MELAFFAGLAVGFAAGLAAMLLVVNLLDKEWRKG